MKMREMAAEYRCSARKLEKRMEELALFQGEPAEMREADRRRMMLEEERWHLLSVARYLESYEDSEEAACL